MVSQAHPNPAKRLPVDAAVPRRWRGTKRLPARKSIDELKKDLVEVERMIRLLEWASARPGVSRG